MTPTTKALFLAALSLTAAPLAGPVLAQKPAPVKLTVNENVRKAQGDAQKLFDQAASGKGDKVQLLTQAETPVAAAEAAARTNDELYVAQELRYRKESLLNAARNAGSEDTIRFAPYLDKLLANPSTPPSQIGDYAYERAHIAYLAGRYNDAIPLFQRARTAGSTNPMLGAFIVDSKIKLQDWAGAAADMEPVITQMKAAGQPVPQSFYLVAIEQAYRAKSPLAAQYELRWNAEYPDRKNWHDSLNRLMTRGQSLDLRQRLDVWRLMRASDAIADEKEKRLYAMDALEAGASREALAVLQTATATDPDGVKLLANAKARAATASDAVSTAAKAKTASDAQSALTAGNFAYAAGNFPLAVEMYTLAQTRGAPDADALRISLGAAQAQAGNKAGAKATFEAVTSSPRKEIAAYWLAWLARG